MTLCGKDVPSIAKNSSSFFALPVTNVIVFDDISSDIAFSVNKNLKSFNISHLCTAIAKFELIRNYEYIIKTFQNIYIDDAFDLVSKPIQNAEKHI